MSSENFVFKGPPPSPPNLIPPTRLMWIGLDSKYGGKREPMKENKLCTIGITSEEVFAHITESTRDAGPKKQRVQ